MSRADFLSTQERSVFCLSRRAGSTPKTGSIVAFHSSLDSISRSSTDTAPKFGPDNTSYNSRPLVSSISSKTDFKSGDFRSNPAHQTNINQTNPTTAHRTLQTCSRCRCHHNLLTLREHKGRCDVVSSYSNPGMTNTNKTMNKIGLITTAKCLAKTNVNTRYGLRESRGRCG